MSDTVPLTLNTTDADRVAHYEQVGAVTATDSEWTWLSGILPLVYPDPSALTLYFDGAAADVDIYLDDVSVSVY